MVTRKPLVQVAGELSELPTTEGLEDTAIGARVYHNADQATATGTALAVAFNSERFDSDSIHSTVTNTTRLTCNTAGKYIVTGHASFDANNTGARQIYIRKNGTVIVAVMDTPPVSGQEMDLSVSTIVSLAANDYLELIAYQTSGSALNVKAHTEYSPEFAMTRLGA